MAGVPPRPAEPDLDDVDVDVDDSGLDEVVDLIDDEAPASRPATPGPSAADRSGYERRSQQDGDPADEAPHTRPSKRRDGPEGDPGDDEKFPWHFSFKDDEPQELQAKTPLLARAFRSSVG
jgi:hypothetical protein